MPRVPGQRGEHTKQANKDYKNVQSVLGEDSDDSTFQSVSTDVNDTNYDLDYTNQGRRTRNSASPRRQAPQQRNTRSGNASHASPNTNPANNTSNRRERSTQSTDKAAAQTRSRNNPANSRRENVGSSRRKSRSPKKRPTIPYVLKEIKKLQTQTRLLIPKLPFSRVIRECLLLYASDGMRVTPTALEALQEAAELYLVQLFSDAYKCTFHRSRVTLMVKDIQLVRFLRGPEDPGNL